MMRNRREKMTDAYLIIDVGSGSIRVLLYDMELRVMDSETLKTDLGGEFDAVFYWDTACTLIKSLLARNQSVEVKGISASTFLGWTVTDPEGQALRSFSYLCKNNELAEEAARVLDAKDVYQKSGRRITGELGGFHLKRIKEEDPQTYSRIHKFISFKDYFNLRLTGIYAIDHTSAAYSMLYDIKGKAWNREIISLLGLSEKHLVPVSDGSSVIGCTSQKCHDETGLPEGIPVTAGGPDGSVGALGSGLFAAGDMVSVMGTTDVFFAISDKAVYDPQMRLVVNPFVAEGRWLIGGPMGLSGGTLEWFYEHMTGRQTSLRELDELAKKLPPGAGGVTALCGLTGERTPFWDGGIKGTVTGITTSTTSGHIYRAFIEANCYTERYVIEILRELGLNTGKLIAIGGGSKSGFWTKLKADITGHRVYVPEIREATAHGSAMLAAMGIGGKTADRLPEHKIKWIREPDSAIAENYDKCYHRYMRLMELCSRFYKECD